MVFFFSLSFFKFCLNKRILSRGQFYSLFQYFFFSYLSFVWWAVKVLLKVWIKRILSGGRVCGGQWIERTKKSISGSSNYSSGKLSKTFKENIFWKRKYFFERKPFKKMEHNNEQKVYQCPVKSKTKVLFCPLKNKKLIN